MTKSEALFKLLALGPLSRRELSEITGWSRTNVRSALQHLKTNERIVYRQKQWIRLDEGLRSEGMDYSLQAKS